MGVFVVSACSMSVFTYRVNSVCGVCGVCAEHMHVCLCVGCTCFCISEVLDARYSSSYDPLPSHTIVTSFTDHVLRELVNCVHV